jgi:biopolymer transport protein TolR
VVLVLLIIFMVITPVLRLGYEASVPPKARDGERLAVPAEQLVLRLAADGGLFINSQRVAPGTFGTTLREVLKGRETQPAFVAANGRVPYQKVMAFVDLCRDAGATNLAIVLDELEK